MNVMNNYKDLKNLWMGPDLQPGKTSKMKMQNTLGRPATNKGYSTLDNIMKRIDSPTFGRNRQYSEYSRGSAIKYREASRSAYFDTPSSISDATQTTSDVYTLQAPSNSSEGNSSSSSGQNRDVSNDGTTASITISRNTPILQGEISQNTMYSYSSLSSSRMQSTSTIENPHSSSKIGFSFAVKRTPIRNAQCTKGRSSSTSGASHSRSSKSSKSPYFEMRTPISNPRLLAVRSNSISGTSRSSVSPHSTFSSPGSSSMESSIVVAITEGRGYATGEIGLAAVDISRPYISLNQMSDSQSYANMLHQLHVLDPIEVLIPNTFVTMRSRIPEILRDNFPTVSVTTTPRRFFNDAEGLQSVANLCVPEYSSVQLIVLHKFYALSALSALLKHLELNLGISFLSRSVRIDYRPLDDIMFIDMNSAQKLELITCLNNKCRRRKDVTLYGILNHCVTYGGKRLLRAAILQPPSKEASIKLRLDSVTELVENKELYSRLMVIMPKFWNVEQLLGLCKNISTKESLSISVLHINYALMLRSALTAATSLRVCLSEAKSEYLLAVRETLQDDRYEKILSRLNKTLADIVHVSKNSTMSAFQRCFAVKANYNGVLDLTRLIYSELVGDINNKVRELSLKYKLPLVVRCIDDKGPVIQINAKHMPKNMKLRNLPTEFTQVQRSGQYIRMNTKEVLFLKHRIMRIMNEIQTISGKIIYILLEDIKEDIGCLYKLCECIAELDVISALARASSNSKYVRPTFGNDTRLVESRHPILDHSSLIFRRVVPNDVIASETKNFHLLTGTNMGGKSVYIRQVALLQIMAQMGCYVPADEAQFRICDRLFTRLGYEECMECNASSFALELKEMETILRTATPTSVIVIDELCRGTSTEEGTCLAWAFCEKLAKYKAYSFVTTHFIYLTKLAESYPNVSNHYFEVFKNPNLGCNKSWNASQLILTHRLLDGVIRMQHYGLHTANATALPDSIKEDAYMIAHQLDKEWKEKDNNAENVERILIELEDYINQNDLDENAYLEIRNCMERLNSLIDGNDQSYQPIPKMGVSPLSEISIITGSQTSRSVQRAYPTSMVASSSNSSEVVRAPVGQYLNVSSNSHDLKNSIVRSSASNSNSTTNSDAQYPSSPENASSSNSNSKSSSTSAPGMGYNFDGSPTSEMR